MLAKIIISMYFLKLFFKSMSTCGPVYKCTTVDNWFYLEYVILEYSWEKLPVRGHYDIMRIRCMTVCACKLSGAHKAESVSCDISYFHYIGTARVRFLRSGTSIFFPYLYAPLYCFITLREFKAHQNIFILLI